MRTRSIMIDGRHHRPLARLLDGKAMADQLQHGLSHRTARDGEVAHQSRHAERRARCQRTSNDGLSLQAMASTNRLEISMGPKSSAPIRLPTIDTAPCID